MYIVQSCFDASEEANWQNSDNHFSSKKAAREWFDNKYALNSSFDWRVGFLVRERNGIYRRLLDTKTGQPATY